MAAPEIGSMTAEEFLRFRNPEGKWHGPESYDFSLKDLNRDYAHRVGTLGSRHDEMFAVDKLTAGYLVHRGSKLVGVICDGVYYFDDPRLRSSLPTYVFDHRGANISIAGDIRDFKRVKYLSEFASCVSPTAKLNEKNYPIVLQRIVHGDARYAVRAEEKPKKDAGVALAVFNDAGEIVARASNEWGATLLSVAREYRGKGLGTVLGRYWYEFNPSFLSGGMTDAGKQNALALWRDRVRGLSAQGWYTKEIRAGRLTKEKVQTILVGAAVPKRAAAPSKPVTVAKGTLVYIARDGISFVIYDRAFLDLDEGDEKFIHGFGFFRDAPKIGTFLYAIDYDRPFAKLTTAVALQIARDRREKLYVGQGYGDLVEWEGLPGVERHGNCLTMTRDLVPAGELAAAERAARRGRDPYGEKLQLLLEMAESKWSG